MAHFDYVTTCVNYVDYLEVSYKHNKDEFDRFTVVTSTKDEETKKFCRDNGINFVATDVFYVNGAKFEKGVALNYAFAALKADADWIVIMDADTFVPKGFKDKMSSYSLDKEFFYGTQRVLLPTYKDYLDLLGGKPETDFEIPLGLGYGYFQMINWNSSVIQNKPLGQLWYPASPHGDATESDWMFRNKWGEHLDHDYTKWKGKLDKLPFNVYNLGKHGQNHFGRVSEKFI